MENFSHTNIKFFFRLKTAQISKITHSIPSIGKSSSIFEKDVIYEGDPIRYIFKKLQFINQNGDRFNLQTLTHRNF